jgi:hypothetical protein
MDTVIQAAEVDGAWYIIFQNNMFCATRERPEGCNYIRVEQGCAFIESHCDNVHNSTLIWSKLH